MDALEQLRTNRIEKAEKLREMGNNPFGNDFIVKNTIDQLIAKGENLNEEELEKLDQNFQVAGRVIAIRRFGKAGFIKIRDRKAEIQVYVAKNLLGDNFQCYKLTDVGDHVGVSGSLFRTRTGELTILPSQYQLVTKSFLPLPEKWHGLTDIETRYRQRYVDLIANPQIKDNFIARAKAINYIRRFLESQDFLEVETPMMHSLASGATAKPFSTHHNALDMDLYLRVAPELFLKRLVVGGLERVFEINKNFRNEGISSQHNPEFTMLEFYMAYATYQDLMLFTETMISDLVKELRGDSKITYLGQEIDFTPPWQRLSLLDAIEKYAGISKDQCSDKEALLNKFKELQVEIDPQTDLGKLQMELFELTTEEKLVGPVFITDFPIAVSPLSRKKDDNPDFVDRFELYISGMEIANAFSELNDPLDQKERFEKQMELKAGGDEEAMDYDADYIRALEYGMPPTAGEGIGIDRLVMILTDSQNIREVILFPLLKNVD